MSIMNLWVFAKCSEASFKSFRFLFSTKRSQLGSLTAYCTSCLCVLYAVLQRIKNHAFISNVWINIKTHLIPNFYQIKIHQIPKLDISLDTP